MLHILLLILKIAGIIIAVILGILLLLIGILLFVPARYEVRGRCDGSLDSFKGKVHLTWFLHLIRADVLYKNKKAKWRLRIAWIKKENGTRKQTSDTYAEKKEESNDEENSFEESESKNIQPAKVEESLDAPQTVCEESAPDPEPEKRKEKMEFHEKEESVDSQKNGKIYERIIRWFQKIKCTFQKMCDKIKALSTKKEKVVLFLQDEVHQGAYQRCKKELRRFFRHMKPKKADIQLIYGFEDPYYTGQVLAFLSMIYPFIGECASITPDFENQVLKGSAYLKGRIYLFHFVQILWNLIWSKRVRQTYRDIRDFKI